MPPPRKQEAASAARELMKTFEARLGTTLGVRLTLLERLFRTREAVPLALAWLLLYAVGAGLTIWWSNDGRTPAPGHAKLVTLIVWSGLHFPVLIAITRLATVRVLDLVRRDILPYASDEYAASVKEALDSQHSFLKLRLVPLAAAAMVVGASVWALREEISPVWWTAPRFPLDLLFWSAAYFYIAWAAMRVVVVTAFPRAFAAALDAERQALYPLRAADSPLVRGLAALNRTILLYWVTVFLGFGTVMLLLLPEQPFALAPDSAYLFVLVPVVAFFTLGLGALVYLGSESAIAAALRRYSLERAETLQREIAALLDRPGEADDDTAARLDRLARLHDQIVEGGSYGSRVGTAVSVTLPLTLPAIGLIEKLFG